MAVKYWETKFSLECTEDWTCLMTRLGSSWRSVQSRKTRPQAGTSVIKPHFKAHKSRSCSQFNKVKSACILKTSMFHLTKHDYWESFQSLMKYKALYYFKWVYFLQWKGLYFVTIKNLQGRKLWRRASNEKTRRRQGGDQNNAEATIMPRQRKTKSRIEITKS